MCISLFQHCHSHCCHNAALTFLLSQRCAHRWLTTMGFFLCNVSLTQRQGVNGSANSQQNISFGNTGTLASTPIEQAGLVLWFYFVVLTSFIMTATPRNSPYNKNYDSIKFNKNISLCSLACKSWSFKSRYLCHDWSWNSPGKFGTIPPKSGRLDTRQGCKRSRLAGMLPPEKIEIWGLQAAGNALKLFIHYHHVILYHSESLTISSGGPIWLKLWI